MEESIDEPIGKARLRYQFGINNPADNKTSPAVGFEQQRLGFCRRSFAGPQCRDHICIYGRSQGFVLPRLARSCLRISGIEPGRCSASAPRKGAKGFPCLPAGRKVVFSLPTSNSTRSPSRSPRRLRTSTGIVIWPLLVIVAENAIPYLPSLRKGSSHAAAGRVA